MKNLFLLAAFTFAYFITTAQLSPAGKPIFEFDPNSSPRWSSFENITAEKGKGGMENNGNSLLLS